ncbi:MAG: hypothetical protein ACRD3W_09365, partial [Terriglobales bacterium]
MESKDPYLFEYFQNAGWQAHERQAILRQAGVLSTAWQLREATTPLRMTTAYRSVELLVARARTLAP